MEFERAKVRRLPFNESPVNSGDDRSEMWVRIYDHDFDFHVDVEDMSQLEGTLRLLYGRHRPHDHIRAALYAFGEVDPSYLATASMRQAAEALGITLQPGNPYTANEWATHQSATPEEIFDEYQIGAIKDFWEIHPDMIRRWTRAETKVDSQLWDDLRHAIPGGRSELVYDEKRLRQLLKVSSTTPNPREICALWVEIVEEFHRRYDAAATHVPEEFRQELSKQMQIQVRIEFIDDPIETWLVEVIDDFELYGIEPRLSRDVLDFEAWKKRHPEYI